MSRKRRQPIKPSGLSASAEQVAASFREMVKRIPCPHCLEPFTNAAVDWGDQWVAGNIEERREEEMAVRDGPYKVKCEWCGGLSYVNYFASTASKA